MTSSNCSNDAESSSCQSTMIKPMTIESHAGEREGRFHGKRLLSLSAATIGWTWMLSWTAGVDAFASQPHSVTGTSLSTVSYDEIAWGIPNSGGDDAPSQNSVLGSSRRCSAVESTTRQYGGLKPCSRSRVTLFSTFMPTACYTISGGASRSRTAMSTVKRRPTGRRSMSVVPGSESRTSLRYCDGDDHETSFRRLEHDEAAGRVVDRKANVVGSPRWWNAVFHVKQNPPRRLSPACKNEAEQFLLDDYLEGLDRRYRRLHRDENGPQSTLGIRTAWNWLMEHTPMHHVDAAKQQENALCVLGLAQLASERLLQKHGLPVPNDVDNLKRVVDTTSSGVDIVVSQRDAPSKVKATGYNSFALSAGAAMMANYLAAGSSVLKRVQARRQAFIDLQSKQILSVISYGVKSAPCCVAKAIKTFIHLSGGKNTLRAAVTVAASLLLIIRPLAHSVVREAAFNA